MKKTRRTGALQAAPRRSPHLVDGKYSIRDLLNLDRLKGLFEQFTAITGISIGFNECPGQETLVASAWQDICSQFHRRSPEARAMCFKSNVALSAKCRKAGTVYFEPCRNGLIDAGTPIVIKGKHIATLVGGQVMFQPPDAARFRKQAKKYGFDPEQYLEAVRKVPVVPRDRFKQMISLLGEMALIVSELGYRNLELKEEAQKLSDEVEERRRAEGRLRRYAREDFQTGVYNHRYLTGALETEFERAKRGGKPFSVILFDIDYFKSINDVYGHHFGDLVLKQFAAELRRTVVRSGAVTRCGGEEFAILAPSFDRSRSLEMAGRIIDTIGTRGFGTPRQQIRLKVSASVASFPEDGAVKGEDLLDLADMVIREAKEGGGNRVYSSADLLRNGSRPVTENGELPEVRSLRKKIEKLNSRGKQSVIESIFAFAKAIELKDAYTGKHGEMTVLYATEIARALRLPPPEVEKIREAAVLHDLGKIGVSDRILHKKASLSPREMSVIRKHPQIAADIIRPIQFMHDLIPLILYHHERWDGKGYPHGLKGEEIPIGARIVAVADVFQALTSDRPYRKAYSIGDAMEIMRKGAGRQFDPRIVEIFSSLAGKNG